MIVFATVVLFAAASVTAVYGRKENNTYIILAPKVFRPGMVMVLRVSILKSVSPVDVKAAIRNEFTKVEIATANGSYEAGKPGNLEIKVPFGNAVKQASYEVFVNGTGGLQFSEKSYIKFEDKGFSIYIQTDKGIYKPGQTVHMRILAVYPDLKPYNGKMTVSMLDPNDNKMQHWADLKGPAGVIEKDFTLSSDPVYGNWKISVLAEGQKKEQTIEIKEYVLPRFKVSVKLPPFVIDGAKELKGKVISKYTYGKGVKGTATVRAFFAVWNPNKQMEVTKSIVVGDGSGSFSFSMEHINKIFKSSWTWYKTVFDAKWVKLTVNATMEEDLTGKTVTAENQVSFYKTDVKLSFPKINPGTFKPGLKYIGVLAVTKPDDTPLPPDRLKKLKIYVKTNFMFRSKGKTEEYTPSAEGFITLTKEIPQNAETIRFQASLDESLKDHVYHSAQKAVSPSSSYIQLSTSSSSYEAGGDVECKLRASFVLTNLQLTYMVMARGNIVLNKVENLSTSTKEALFKFKTSHLMAPSARLIVYIIQKDGEVVVDSVNLRVDKPFKNEVYVSYSRKESRPGDQVILKTKATPGSYVGILAVDESVLLMNKDNDFSQKKVMEELQSYDSAPQIFPWFYDWGPRRRRRTIMPFPTSGQDAASVFENSGIVVLSNCNVYRQFHPWIAYEGAIPIIALSGDGGNTLLKAANAGGQPQLKEVTRVRTLFPETWIWHNTTVDTDGEVDLVVSVPDTITSWVASAFALHSKAGFGVASFKPKLKVFQPFFVSLDLPYSVIRGEQVAIKVLVFNYLDEAMEVKVTLKKSANWHGINELSNKLDVSSEIAPDIVTMVTVPAGEGEAVLFPIVPKTLGNVPVVVQTQSTQASDAVRRDLLVEAEGIPQDYSYSLLIDLNSTNQMRRELELVLPPRVVEGSARAKVTIIGDILGSSISNLDDLLRMPYGCGEQNMVNFAPSIFIMKYLSTVNQLTADIKNKAENYMKSGYQRQQTYRHKEGSYSAFGERDASGSLWLTAFVAKSFAQARDYIYIDPDSLRLSLDWIVRQQKTDGSFPRVGKVHSSALKGGLKGEVALTAYVLITLVEAKSSDKRVTVAIKNTINYIEGVLDRTLKEEDPYTLAIVYYVLSLRERPSRHAVKQKLRVLAQKQDGTAHWAEKKVMEKKPSWWSPYYKPPSADIEITAYVLLALTIEKDMKLGLEVVRWLSQQRNSLGGYSSTQDTVVGIQALAEFASLVYSPKVSFNVNIRTKQLDRTVTVDSKNVMVLQVIDLPKVEGVLKINASGHGVGMLQVGVTYHVNSTSEKPSFDFRFKIVKDGLNELETEACAKWTGDSDASDMAVMEIGIISGFSLDSEQARTLLSNKELSLKRVDTSGRKVMLYFDEIRKSSKTCVRLRFERSHAVGKAQPVPVVLYDYYHPEKRSSALYTSEKLSSDDVCKVCFTCVNCGNQTGSSARPRGSAPGIRGSWLTPVLAVVVTVMAAAQRLN